MCDSFGNQCFYMTINKNSNVSLECAHCDYDCNRTQHTTSMVIRKVDAEKFCTDRNSDYPMLEINRYIDITPTNHNHNPHPNADPNANFHPKHTPHPDLS